ncbi:MAG: hypothetical protein ABIS69_08340 [Sediminibacterium sp.]
MLTKEQVDRLFVFCEKHFVRHYDLQLELVDHLANAIEAIWETDTQLSFESALDRVYKSFGVMGFAGVVSARSRLMEKQYSKQKWLFFVSYFTLPKIALTICCFLLLSLPFRFLSEEMLHYFIGTVLLGLYFFEIRTMAAGRKKVKKQNRILLLTAMTSEYAWLPSILVAQLFGSDHIPFSSEKMTIGFVSYEWIMLVVTICFVGILAYKDTVKQVFLIAEKKYPEVFSIAT